MNTAVDGAVSSINGDAQDCSILEIGDVNGTAAATENMAVRKRGRTTELTHGTVVATDYTTNVDYGDGLGVITFTNQIRIANDPALSPQFGISGDSGSVVVDASNNVVGLFFAGNSAGTVGVANQIAAVTDALNVTICTGGLKKLEKETPKEFKEFIDDKSFLKNEKIEIKELKEFDKKYRKEFIKEWKEYAKEKFDWENVFDPWDRVTNPWDRPPVVTPPVVTRPPVVNPRQPGFRGLASWKEVPVRDDCAYFSHLPEGDGPNPVEAHPFYLYVSDWSGNPVPQSRIVTWGSSSGLDVGFETEIRIDGKCPVIQATLVHFSQPATLEAFNGDGALAGSATMGDTQGVEQTLTVSGDEIVYARISSPSNETILVRLCICCETSCQSCEECEPCRGDRKGKEKEIHKEQLENKQQKDQLQESPFTRGGSGGLIEERLAALEAMLGVGGASHFIQASQRPDLTHGALRYEPGANDRARLRRQRGR